MGHVLGCKMKVTRLLRDEMEPQPRQKRVAQERERKRELHGGTTRPIIQPCPSCGYAYADGGYCESCGWTHCRGANGEVVE